MKHTVPVACAAGLAAVIVLSGAGCGGNNRGTDTRACPSIMKEHHLARHGHGCPPEHRYGSMNVIAPREFFDTGDLDGGRDSLYGGGPRRSTGDRDDWQGSLDDDFRQAAPHDCRCRHEKYRDHEDAISERHAPSMDPEAYYHE